MDLRYLCRYNICEMRGHLPHSELRPLRRGADRYPCFAAAFDFMNNRPKSPKFVMNYKLHIFKEIKDSHNNFAILTKKDMCRFLNSFKFALPFIYSFKDKKDRYILNIDITGTAFQNKALLMLSRSLFEFPHNLCAYDALKLRELGHLEEISLKNYSLFTLYLLCLSSTDFSRGESIINKSTPELISIKILKELTSGIEKTSVAEKLPYKDKYPVRKIEPLVTTDDIFSEEKFHKRIQIYLHNLKENLNA